MLKRRQEYFKDKSCKVCGSIDKLELDHIDPELKIDHKIWSWSNKRRSEELAKCQVLCEEHHMEKTVKQFSKPITHGTSSGYNSKNYKCRCELCTKAHAEYMYEWRHKSQEDC